MANEEVDITRASVTAAAIGFGQTMYVLYVPDYAPPVGFVWGIGDYRKVFDVAGSYVEPWARRKGVRTRLNEEIFKEYTVIRSSYGSEDGGQAFMKAQGYKFNRALHCFYLTRPKKRARKAAK